MLRDRLVIVWLALVAATLLAAWVGGALGRGRPGPGAAALAVLAIAFAKVAAVVFHYMDVRRAPLALKVAWGAWLAVVLTVLCLIYGGF